MKELPKKYNHKESEKKWQDSWFASDVYKWDDRETRENTYVIDTPPPTVSGLLHMGHIFSYTQADFIARYQRMQGKTVFYPMGFDDNGLPTERLVEKVKKIKAAKVGREKFIEICEDVAEDARNEFRRLFKSTALSVDWDQEYHTVSEDSRKISQLSFLDLFEKEKTYRKLQPMLWDPMDQTAIAQAEVEDKEEKSHANYINFGIITEEQAKDPSSVNWDEIEKVEIMTTRPELLGACVALMCHPNDEGRFAGKKAVTPLFNIVVDIVTDDKVDKDKGTGLVMCCTFGDETDIAWWREHNLETRIILNKYGKITDNFAYDVEKCINIEKAHEIYNQLVGKKARPNTGNIGGSAREIVVELLKEEKDAFIRQEEITHMEPCAERSGAALEILPTQQWFVKILDQKEELKKKAEECNWYPEYMKIRIDQWIDGLSWDWCISRQRYFGVPFPVWYVKEFNKGEWKIIVASPEQLPVNPLVDLPDGCSPISGAKRDFPEQNEIVCTTTKDLKDQNGNIVFRGDGETHLIIRPEADVMDTWATSSVSPQLSSHGITKDYTLDNDRHRQLFPADLRPQAHEIIRTWAFYTIVKAHLHEDVIPWKNLMISGWCLASDKTKMSKSKGNVVTPITLIEEKGTDAVRYWASTSNLGSDTAFSEDVLKIGSKLVNKIWNATKFGAIQLQHLKETPTTAKNDIDRGIIINELDKWIISRLGKAITKATSEFEKYEYCKARNAIEDFFWNDFCDNYLEMAKARAYNEEGKDKIGQQSAVVSIYHILDGILKLFAPFVPHITEELYSHIFDDKYADIGSIHSRGTWPIAEEFPIDEESESLGVNFREILDVIRKLKAEKNVSIRWPIEKLQIRLLSDDKTLQYLVRENISDLMNVSNSKLIEWNSNLDNFLETENKSFGIIMELSAESEVA